MVFTDCRDIFQNLNYLRSIAVLPKAFHSGKCLSKLYGTNIKSLDDVSIFRKGGDELRLQRLALLCRFCGNEISIHSKYKYPVNIESDKHVISDLFHINVVNEKEAVFPKKGCERFKRQLDGYKKRSTEFVPHSDLACFSPHYETDCHVC